MRTRRRMMTESCSECNGGSLAMANTTNYEYTITVVIGEVVLFLIDTFPNKVMERLNVAHSIFPLKKLVYSSIRENTTHIVIYIQLIMSIHSQWL